MALAPALMFTGLFLLSLFQFCHSFVDVPYFVLFLLMFPYFVSLLIIFPITSCLPTFRVSLACRTPINLQLVSPSVAGQVDKRAQGIPHTTLIRSNIEPMKDPFNAGYIGITFTERLDSLYSQFARKVLHHLSTTSAMVCKTNMNDNIFSESV